MMTPAARRAYAFSLSLLAPGNTFWQYSKCGNALFFAQSLAVLEVVHPLVGLVKTNALLTAVQVYSRIFLTWGVMYVDPACVTKPLPLGFLAKFLPINGEHADTLKLGFETLMYAWGVTEVVRYSYFVMKLIWPKADGRGAELLTRLRYSTFIVLYPLGVASELVLVYRAFDAIKALRPYCIDLPNAFNFAFDYPTAAKLTAASYVIFFPKLYGHMFKQRLKYVGPLDDRRRARRGGGGVAKKTQ